MANERIVMVLRADAEGSDHDHDVVATAMQSAFRDVWAPRGWEEVTDQDEIDALYEADAKRRAEQEKAEQAGTAAPQRPNAEAATQGEQAGLASVPAGAQRPPVSTPPPVNPGGSTGSGN